LVATMAVLVALTVQLHLPETRGEFHTEMVPMRDGAELAADIWLPEGEGPWPTILVRDVYGRAQWHPFCVPWGYALVVQDLRDVYETDGWGVLQDGYDTVEWIAAQPWSNGRIATYGGSGRGLPENLLAGSYPPHLVCQYIYWAPSDFYSQWAYHGGVFKKNDCEGWANWYGFPDKPATWIAHPSYDSYWASMNSDTRASGMTYPALHVGGWYDMFSQGTLNAFMERQHNGGVGSRGNQKLIMGTGGHAGWPQTRGDIDLIQEGRDFFDYWMKGVNNGWMDRPAVRYYVMGDIDGDPSAPGNEWREADDWPIPYVNLSLYLNGAGLTMEPGSDSNRSYVYDPKNPVPTRGGNNLHLPGGPMDQRPVESRDDVLVYSTDPLPVPVEITGRVRMQLFASSSCPDTDFMVKLTDVYPDGRSINVLDGAIRARYRESLEYEKLMEPGKIYEFWIDLWSTSIIFNRGHRIRVDISSSNDPRFDPNPNTGHPLRADDETRVANNTIFAGTSYPSRILLPLAGPDRDGDGAPDLLDPPTKDQISQMIQRTATLLDGVGDRGLDQLLRSAFEEARTRLEREDLSGVWILDMIDEASCYDPGDIISPGAREMVDAALDSGRRRAGEGLFSDMTQFIRMGWFLGTLRQDFEGLPGGWILIEHLSEAQQLTNQSLFGGAAEICQWLNRTDVQALANRIANLLDNWDDLEAIADGKGVSSREIGIIKGMLDGALEQFMNRKVENSESMMLRAEDRLQQLGVVIPEGSPITFILVVVLGYVLFTATTRKDSKGFVSEGKAYTSQNSAQRQREP